MSRSGFTLIEILVSMALLTTLAAIALPLMHTFRERAFITRAIGDVNAMQIEVESFASSKGYVPASLAEINRGNMLDP